MSRLCEAQPGGATRLATLWSRRYTVHCLTGDRHAPRPHRRRPIPTRTNSSTIRTNSHLRTFAVATFGAVAARGTGSRGVGAPHVACGSPCQYSNAQRANDEKQPSFSALRVLRLSSLPLLPLTRRARREGLARHRRRQSARAHALEPQLLWLTPVTHHGGARHERQAAAAARPRRRRT